jgi:acetyl-CoA acetyltransferase
MANTAEKLAAQFSITRAQCDEFAVRSQVQKSSSCLSALSIWLIP